MMFLPLPEVVTNTPIRNKADILVTLDKYVSPRYLTTKVSNVGYTKSECFGILQSFFAAGMLYPGLTPRELNDAVRQFMDESLWVKTDDFDKTSIPSNFDPNRWFAYPLSQQVRDVFRLYLGWFMGFFVISTRVCRLLLTDLVRVSKHVKYGFQSK